MVCLAPQFRWAPQPPTMRTTLKDVTSDPRAETDEEMSRSSMKKDDVHQALDRLTQREKQVIAMRFGLDDGRTRTLQEIGNILGVCRERVRQIESAALRKLKSKEMETSMGDLNDRIKTAYEKQVVATRFGLDDGRIKTLQEVANIMGGSMSRISHIEAAALRELRSKNMETYGIVGDECDLDDNAQ